MQADPQKARELFLHAVGKLPPEEWEEYVAMAAGEDLELQRQVQHLLQVHRDAGSFLESPAIGPDPASPMVAAESASLERPGEWIGPYKLLQVIGEGGMGTVFMAEQSHPVQRKVALKVIKAGMDSGQVIARFEAERQALALMDHPNIAKVLDAGTTAAGRPYFVMELVKGVPITTYCDENHLSPKARLELFTQVCQALQHAHHKGVIHRDLKPSNVLVTLYDDRPVPKVIDFGVAKATGGRLTERTMFTGFGQIVGTLEYMSPEQARLNALDIDTRGDIYSLGVLLYELLTGTTPFDKKRLREAAFDEMLRMIREEEPPKPSTRLSTSEGRASIAANRSMEPSKLSGLVRGELDWIVMKALEKDRNRRYETANGFAMDVQRYLADEPVQACPPSAGYRFRKFARRNKAALATAAIVAATLVLGMLVSAWQAIRATNAESLAETRLEAETEAREQADDSRKEAVSEREQARRRLYEARLAQARAGRTSGQIGQRLESLKALQEAVELAKELKLDEVTRSALRQEAIACLALSDTRLLNEWEGRRPDMSANMPLDAALRHYAMCDLQGTIRVHQVGDGAELVRLESPAKQNHSLGFLGDGSYLSARNNKEALLWDWRERAVKFRTSPMPEALALSPDNQRLAFQRESGRLRIANLNTGKEDLSFQTGVNARSICFSPDGSKLAVSSYADKQVQVRDTATGKLLWKFADPPVPYAGLAWHPEGRLLAASGNDFIIHLWNVQTGEEHAVLRGHGRLPDPLQFSFSGDVAFDGTRLWDPWSGQERLRLLGGSGSLSRDGRKIAWRTGTQLSLYELVGGEEYRVLPAWEESENSQIINRVARISPDGRWLGIAQHHGLRLFDLNLSRQTVFLPIGLVKDFAFHPLGRELIISSPTGLHRWPFLVERTSLRIGPPKKISAAFGNEVALDAAGRWLAFADVRYPAGVLDLEKPGSKPLPLKHFSANYVTISPDGRLAVTGPHHGLGIKVWETATGNLVRDFFPAVSVAAARFSPDGRHLVTNVMDGGLSPGLTFWHTDSWQEERKVATNGGRSFNWSPDGKIFAFALSAHQVVLQDPSGGRTLATLEAPGDLRVNQVIFTRGGDKLVVVSEQPAQAHVWDLRLIRTQLAKMGLDWDAPPYSPAAPTDASQTTALKVDVQLVDPAYEAARAKEREGNQHRVAGQYIEAIACYREVLQSEQNNKAMLNELAWLLATCADPKVRDPKEAIVRAGKAVELDPKNAAYANTLAVALYRAAEWKAATAALEKSLEMHKGGDSINWFFLAMAHWQLDEKDEARKWYDQAALWMERNKPEDEELRRFRAEAMELLKIEDKQVPK